MIACEKTGRKAFLMELDAKYCDVIVKRWQDFTGKTAHLEDGRTFADLEAARGGQSVKPVPVPKAATAKKRIPAKAKKTARKAA